MKELYKDPSQPIELRVEDLISKMTLEEKVAQLGSIWAYQLLDENGNFDLEKAKSYLNSGIGQITRPGGATNFEGKKVAEFVNNIQEYLVKNTRLGIPAMMHEECLTGYMGLDGTNYPVPIAMASTWEPQLIEELTSTIREDMRKVGIHQGLAPVLDVARDPRWGRVEETFGESPYLVSKMGAAYVGGLQGKDIKDGIIATAKHFVGYSFSEGGRNWAPTNIPYRELREVFILPFEIAIKIQKIKSIMNSYSEIDGIPVASSKELLTDLIRKEFGFDGIVVSDYFSVNLLHEYHKIAKTKAQAAKLALEAGIDVELPATDCYSYIVELVKKGEIPESLLDNTVRRILKTKFELGLFENPYVKTEKAIITKHYDLAEKVARKSIVLLKNDGILPLQRNKKVALIGPSVADVRNMLGDYSYLAHVKTMLENINENFDAPKFYLKNVEEKVQEQLNKIPSILNAAQEEKIDFVYAKGCNITGESKDGFAEAIEVCKDVDAIIAVVGDRSGLTKDCTTGEARDSATLKLPGVQEELILELSKLGKPIILVLMIGRPYAITNIIEKVNAVLVSWLPGEAGGRAIIKSIFGDFSPSGKLPISFPRSVGQIPLFHYTKPSGGRSS
ncbi:MAG: glycoside hydrolase family 3 protein, partial [Fervidobacterium nodosum]